MNNTPDAGPKKKKKLKRKTRGHGRDPNCTAVFHKFINPL